MEFYENSFLENYTNENYINNKEISNIQEIIKRSISLLESSKKIIYPYNLIESKSKFLTSTFQPEILL